MKIRTCEDDESKVVDKDLLHLLEPSEGIERSVALRVLCLQRDKGCNTL